MPAETKPAAEKPAEQPKPSPAPAEQTPPPEKPAPTPEELEFEAQRFASKQFGTPSPKKPEPKPDPATPAATTPPPKEELKPAEPAEPPPATPPEGGGKKDDKPKEKGKRFVPGKKPATTEEIETVARRVVAEERDNQPEPEPSPKEPSEDLSDLSDEDRDHLQVLTELERINPVRKGVVEAQKKFFRAAAKRRADWEAKNGENSYDPNAEEHADFYRKNEPFVAPRDFAKAKDEMLIRTAEERAYTRAREEARKEYEPLRREQETKKLTDEAAPLIEKAENDAVETIFQSVPEFAAMFKPGELTTEAVAKMAELNPVVHDAIVDDAEEAMAIVGELTRAERLGAHYTPDNNGKQLSSGRVIHPVAMIKTIFHNLEVAMSKATKEERMDKGREWIPYNEHLRRAEAIMNSNATPEVKQRKMDDLTGTTWFIDYPHIHNTYLNQKRQRGKAISERYSKFSTPPAPPAAPVAPPPPVPTPTPKPSAKADLPRSPSTATGSDTADNSGKSKTEGEKFDEKFAAKAF